MIEIYNLLPGVELRCCRDHRFKQNCITIQFVRPMAAGEAAMNALIPTVLLRGTREHPTLRSVTQKLDDLYGAAVGPLVRRIGDYQTMGLSCAFMDQRFALPGDRVMPGMIDFLRELLLDSPTENGGFLPDFVESEKKNLISAMESDLNDKQTYAMSRMLRTMCRGDSFGLPRLGEKEQAAAIDPVSLYDHYQKILRESPVQIFYAGSASAQELMDLLIPVFTIPGRCPGALQPQTDLKTGSPGDHEEVMEVSQGKLCMGFVTPVTNRTADFAAMQVFNMVFGGGMTSKLFMNIREKNSLCYHIGSGYYGVKGILTVAAGIDFDRQEQVQQEVLEQLASCQRGQITPAELNAAKQALISSLRSIHDSPGAIESYYSTAALSGQRMDPEAYRQAIAAVTAEDLSRCAGTLKLHTTYFLKGEAHADLP